MSASRTSLRSGRVPAQQPPDRRAEQSGASTADLAHGLDQLGKALTARSEEVVEAMLSGHSGERLDDLVEERFARVGTVSTIAVARRMAGEGIEVAREVGEESWRIFGQLAAQRAVPLNELTKRCLRWRDASEGVLRETATRLKLAREVLDHALGMLQHSLDVTLVRMCQSFEAERSQAQEELTSHQEQLAFLATHDPLTGLPNRTLMLDRVEQMLVRSRRHHTTLAALLIDLDNFRGVNETLGHGAGDELLRAAAARLQGRLNDRGALGRLGGDEFVVLTEGSTRATEPEPLAERLLETLGQPFELQGAQPARVTVTASIGIALGDRASAEQLLRDADIAMYRAKWAGKNRHATFESGMHQAVQSRMELEMDLRDALQNGEFFLVYQPTFDLRTMSPTRMEALIRWKHPSRGVVQPDAFVPLLEDTGMIVETGRWVLREACRQAAQWHASGYRVGIAVNVSALQLQGEGFVAEVQDALTRSGLDPSALTIEITETTIVRNAEDAAERLAAVRRLGVAIAIDDFGAGYSSLGYLQRFPVDLLKIDRSFISRVAQDPDGETLMRTLVQLGKSLSIETLAEGIEQSSVLSLLKEEQCDSGQGFLFARPLGVAASELFLQTWIGSGDSPLPAASVGAGALAANVPWPA